MDRRKNRSVRPCAEDLEGRLSLSAISMAAHATTRIVQSPALSPKATSTGHYQTGGGGDEMPIESLGS